MKLFAWCDSPLAPTGFGRSAKHVLHALHGAGQEIVQLAVNQAPERVQEIPWKVYMPVDRANDPYGLTVLPEVLRAEQPDMMWSTFDPEVPWRYAVPGVQGPQGQPVSALDFILSLRGSNPGFRAALWVPVDGGPLSDMEMAVLGMGPQFDFVATMSPHVHDLIEWTLQLKGLQPDRKGIEERLHVIPHGIDPADYSIPTKEERAEAKASLGFDPKQTVILQLERNQQRKQNYLALHAMEALFKTRPELRGKVLLYQHMIQDEDNTGCKLGFNLPELCWRYGLKAGVDVRWPRDFIVEEKMPLVYRAADIFLSTSTGEGFQYPAWEALATGVPIVVPNNSARTSWFKGAPNTHLYMNEDRMLVMRGGYNRRMAMPSPAAAASRIAKLLRKPPEDTLREAGARFVQRHANVEKIQSRWVEVMREQEHELTEFRKKGQVAVPEDMAANPLTIVMEHSPGLGDLVLAAPAIAALRRSIDRPIHLRVPGTHIVLARMLDCSDRVSSRRVGDGEEIRIDDLYREGHKKGWGDPQRHRTEVIAEHIGASPGDLAPAIVTFAPEMHDTVRSQFVSTFNVDPVNCIGICLESANPHRAMPRGYFKPLCDGIRALDLTPVLLGRTTIGMREMGVVDLSGQTDLGYLTGLLSLLGAVITTDTATLHFAGMVGTPMVPCFTLFDPSTRLMYYACQVEPVSAIGPIQGEEFPAGPNTKVPPGAWAATITPERILAALRKLLGIEDQGPKIIRPEEA